MSPLPTPSMSPLPTPSMSPLPTPMQTNGETDDSNLNGAGNSESNKTAVIASTLSAAAALVIAGVTSAICYFKNPLSFSCFRNSLSNSDISADSYSNDNDYALNKDTEV